jgi:hypothetical protein
MIRTRMRLDYFTNQEDIENDLTALHCFQFMSSFNFARSLFCLVLYLGQDIL